MTDTEILELVKAITELPKTKQNEILGIIYSYKNQQPPELQAAAQVSGL